MRTPLEQPRQRQGWTTRVSDRRRLLRARDGGEQRVTALELFFYLVYVFAVTRLSHRLLDRLNIGGVLKVNELENGYAFAFPSSDERVTKLVELVNAKRACLPFLAFRLVFEPDLTMLRLR